MKNEKDYEVVGDIRIKQPKTKKNKKKKKDSDTPLITKVFIWFMFIAMFSSFLVPLVYYLISVISSS